LSTSAPLERTDYSMARACPPPLCAQDIYFFRSMDIFTTRDARRSLSTPITPAAPAKTCLLPRCRPPGPPSTPPSPSVRRRRSSDLRFCPVAADIMPFRYRHARRDATRVRSVAAIAFSSVIRCCLPACCAEFAWLFASAIPQLMPLLRFSTPHAFYFRQR